MNDEVGLNDFADDERGDTITAPAETVPFDQLIGEHSMATLREIIADLEKHGLVEIVTNPSCNARRKTRISITDNGSDILQKISKRLDKEEI